MRAVLGLLLVSAPAFAVDFDSARLGAYYPPADAELEAVQEAATAVVRFPRATGFVVDPSGLILTNHHVRRSFGTEGQVRLARTDGHPGIPLRVELVEDDRERDVALYRVVGGRELQLPAIPLRDEPAEVGEPVFVIGHPDGKPQRVSFGSVLATDLSLGGTPSIEYSAQTWWGSSGSPVLDADGRMIAIHWGWDSRGVSNGRLTGVPTEDVLDALPTLRDLGASLPETCLEARGYGVRARATARDVQRNHQGRSLDRVRAGLTVADARCAEHIESVTWTLHPTFRNPTLVGEGGDHGVNLLTWGHFDAGLRVRLSDGSVVTSEGRIAW